MRLLSSANHLSKVGTIEVGRISEFEGLRAILCWIVVAGHSLQFSGFTDAANFSILLAWTNWGGDAVNVFAILSGFVISLLLNSTPEKNYLQFMTERFFRIFPIYLIALIIGIILLPVERAVLAGNWQDPEIASRGLQVVQSAYTHFIYHLISHITLLQGLIPDEILPHSSLTLLGPAWSLSLEWQFYIVAPLLLFLLHRSRSLQALILILIGCNVLRKLVSSYSFGFGAFLPLKMEFFTIGIISFYFYCFCKGKGSQVLKPVYIFLIIVLFGLGILSFLPFDFLAKRAFSILLWFIPFGAIIAEAVGLHFKPFNSIRYILNLPILQKMGKASYSTYLLHVPVIWTLIWLTSTFSPHMDKAFLLVVVLILGFPIIIGISSLSYERIEKPFIRVGKQLSNTFARSC